jgi:hypothetical protein
VAVVGGGGCLLLSCWLALLGKDFLLVVIAASRLMAIQSRITWDE